MNQRLAPFLENACTYLSLGQLGLDSRPRLRLGCVREQVHDNCGLANGLVDVEQVLSWNPAILFGLLPRGAILAHADNDVQSVVAEIQTLAVALRTVADEGKSVVLEVFLAQWLAEGSFGVTWVPLRKA